MMRVITKKQKIAIICVAVAVVLVIAAAITISLIIRAYDEYTTDEIREDAVCSGKMDEVLFLMPLRTLENISKDGVKLIDGVYDANTHEYSFWYYYVLGMKDGQEVAYIYPRRPNEPICKSEWFFDTSFSEMMEMINRSPFDKYHRVYVLNDIYSIRYHIPEAAELPLDIPIAIILDNCAVAQVNGQIQIFEVDSIK